MAKLQALYIEWEDSSYRTGWRDAMGNAAASCTSVGVLVTKSKSQVVLATSTDCDGNFLQQVCIPRSAIRKLRKVTIPR